MGTIREMSQCWIGTKLAKVIHMQYEPNELDSVLLGSSHKGSANICSTPVSSDQANHIRFWNVVFIVAVKNRSFSFTLKTMGFETINELLQNELLDAGFEVHPFLISWYNAMVDPSFRLSTYDDDTVAFLIISTPSMFEKTFLPYALNTYKDLARDPIDCCVKEKIQSVIEKFPDHEIDVLFDYELWPTRRPKVIMQTVGHVSGAAHFYSRQQLKNDPFPKDKNMMGVCLHPKYGGWFALRSVLIFKTLKYPLLPRRLPIDVLNDDEALITDVLQRFNYSWQDGTYRSVVPVIEMYSALQQSYFQTIPKDRLIWLEKLRQMDREKV